MRKFFGIVIVFCLFTSFAYSQKASRRFDKDKFNLDKIFSAENLAPKGQFYEATVPDTLDLAERAKLAVNALTRSLNPDSGYGPYGHAFFKVQPAYMSERMYQPRMDAGTANWGKMMEALVLMRGICGEKLNLDIESKSFKGMIGFVNRSGCCYQNSRADMALMALYRQNPTSELKQLIEYQDNKFFSDVQYEGDYASFDDSPPKLDQSDSGINNYESQTHQNGGPIWALCQWYAINGNPRDLALAGKLNRFVSQTKFWEPETGPRFFVGREHAHFKGHIHSYLGAMMGMIEYANLANDAWLKEFVREGYEYIRNVGIARLGAFGETCTIGDMTVLAAQLSEMGVGDYWDHVDQYVRNHLSEMQITDRKLMEQTVSRMPTLDQLPDASVDRDVFDTKMDCTPGKDTTERMIERNIGAFLTDGGHPAQIPRQNLTYTVCCVGNGAKGLYYAWKSILDYKDGVGKINLLLNRASPWLDIDSYLPYEGKVAIKNKTAEKISVRIPLWVDKQAVKSLINNQPASPFWNGNYLMFDRVKRGDTVTIEFPVVESTATYTLKWKQNDKHFESNWPQDDWRPGSDKYICRFRGNTLVKITPVPGSITAGVGYPLYQRDEMLKTKAPLKKVQRFTFE